MFGSFLLCQMQGLGIGFSKPVSLRRAEARPKYQINCAQNILRLFPGIWNLESRIDDPNAQPSLPVRKRVRGSHLRWTKTPHLQRSAHTLELATAS